MVQPRPKATLPVLFSVVIIDLIGFGIVIPVLPFYARTYGASGFVLGGLLTSYAAMQFVFAPLWGRLSDRIGRRPVMLFTLAGVGVSLLALGLAESLVGLFVARILGGAFAANISVATAYVADVTDPSERTRWMGMIGASFAVGFLIGPALGGLLSPVQTDAGLRFGLLGPAAEELLSPYGYGLPMLAAAALAGLNLLWAVAVLREPVVHREEPSALGAAQVLREPVVLRICAIYFLFCVGVTQLESVFAYWMMDRFDYGAREVAAILVLMAVVMGGVQGGAMRGLAHRFGEKPLLLAGVAVLALGLLAVPFAGSVAVLLVPLVACSIGRAISQPSMLSMVSLGGSPSTRGATLGVFQSSASLARVVGPLAAGALYDLRMAAPFVLASAAMVMAASLGLGLPGRESRGAPGSAGAAPG